MKYWKGRWNYLRSFPHKVQRLVTGNYTWIETTTGESDHEHYDWINRWHIEKPHSASWWWVNRWGKMPCGCGKNPLTKRMAWYALKCEDGHWRNPRKVGHA